MSRSNRTRAQRQQRRERNKRRRALALSRDERHREAAEASEPRGVDLRARSGDAARIRLVGTGEFCQVLGVDDAGQPVLLALESGEG